MAWAQVPVIHRFSAGTPNIIQGQSTALNWLTTGATTISIDHGVGVVPVVVPTPAPTVSPSATTTYTLTATNASGSSTATQLVTVFSSQRGYISSFAASPQLVAPGAPVTLQWSLLGPATLSIDNGVGAVTGSSLIVYPQKTVSYTMRAILPDGSEATACAGVFVDAGGPWTPPIGIPRPSFGIDESHTMFVGQSYDYGGTPGPYKDAGNGPYTHYVDVAHPAATDTGNPFGTPTLPRRTIPLNLTPGSVVELHGGPYDYVSFAGELRFGGRGTAEKPIFVRGARFDQKAEFKRGIRIFRSSYVVLENILFSGATSTGAGIVNPSDHISVRSTEATRFDGQYGMYATVPSSGSNAETDFNDDIVFYRNHLHNTGYPFIGIVPLHNGFQIQGNSRRVWLVDNIIAHGTEDGIHIIFYHNSNYIPADIYVGRNIIHHHGENAIDVKPSRNVIVSENEMYGFRRAFIPPTDGSDGSVLCLNIEAGAPAPNVIENHFIMDNRLSDSDVGLRAEYGGYFFQNLFWNIDGAAVSIRHANPLYIVANTITSSQVGIYNNGGGAVFYAYDNVISGVGRAHLHYNTGSTREVRNNLFWNGDGKAAMTTGGDDNPVIRGLSLWPTSSGALSCVEADPLLVSENPASPGFLRLSATSPAVDAGTSADRVQELLTRFQSVFGAVLDFDFARTPRPQGLAWDIGAFEYRDPASGAGFVPLAPCRVLDTRVAAGSAAAAPILAAGDRRLFTVVGRCGVPVTALAISANLTVVGATATGDLQVVGGHLTSTNTSALSIPVSRARANNAIVQLSATGDGTIAAINVSTGPVHVILDVNGYFR
jgi:hypothetical protein